MMTRKLSLLFVVTPFAAFNTRPQSAKSLQSSGISSAPATFNKCQFTLKFIYQ
ncbi:hypothetical protein OQX61_23760 [Pedobacter sp. PLR]|uniref:hypothetical protein n=1 Tax=Pedobacter sp. PLR TaxID=2994465 RepID=UPI002247EB36|nr:hypothetical protein [Pedobacter sp. PLR]MCX2454307.1 hypothetical protein [Pedobacter sp. PLR]